MPPRQPVGAGQYGDGLASVVDVVRKEGMKAKGPKKERPKKKKIYKYLVPKCVHGKEKKFCRECDGSGLCPHKRYKWYCKECKGPGICAHNRVRSTCRECGGIGFCIHDRRKSQCKECKGGSICEHNKVRNRCRDCGGKSLCEHGKVRHRCRQCICEHKRIRRACTECKAIRDLGPGLLANKIHEVLALLEREQFPIPSHPRSGEISSALTGLRSLALAHAAPPPRERHRQEQSQPPLPLDPQQQPHAIHVAEEAAQDRQEQTQAAVAAAAAAAPPLGHYQLIEYLMHHNMRAIQLAPSGSGGKKGGMRDGKADWRAQQRRLEAINKAYVEGLQEVAALLDEGVLSAQEFEREKQGLLRQRQAQVLHHHHQLQQVFNLPGPQAGVDKGVADALLAGPPSFESGGVGGQGGGGWMTGGSKLMNGGRASKQAQPTSTSGGQYSELLSQHQEHGMQQQQMLHLPAYAAPKSPRLSKAQKRACSGSGGREGWEERDARHGCEPSEPCREACEASSLVSSDPALASCEGPSPTYGAGGASAFGQNAWASAWNASAQPPPPAPLIAPAGMYAGMPAGMSSGMSSGMGAQMLAMQQQHLLMVQHAQAIAKKPAPPRRPRAKKGEPLEKAVGARDVAAGGSLLYESSDHGVVQGFASGGMDGTLAGAPPGLQDSYSAATTEGATIEGCVPFASAPQTAHSPASLLQHSRTLLHPPAFGTGDAARGS